MQAINSGDTAFILIAAALVLFMTPGLALFYGGMVRSKNVDRKYCEMRKIGFKHNDLSTKSSISYSYRLG